MRSANNYWTVPRPLGERLLFRMVSAAGFQERLLPNGISTKNTFKPEVVDVISSQFEWQMVGQNLKIRFRGKINADPGEIENIDRQCVYTAIVPPKHAGYLSSSRPRTPWAHAMH